MVPDGGPGSAGHGARAPTASAFAALRLSYGPPTPPSVLAERPSLPAANKESRYGEAKKRKFRPLPLPRPVSPELTMPEPAIFSDHRDCIAMAFKHGVISAFQHFRILYLQNRKLYRTIQLQQSAP